MKPDKASSEAISIVLGLGALFLYFVLLFSRRLTSHSRETLRELPRDPIIILFLLAISLK